MNPTSAVTAMLQARSVALVGASPRPGSFGERMVIEASSIGHDLSRGTSKFTRNLVRIDADEDDDAEQRLAS